jgi:hypothetical protein
MSSSENNSSLKARIDKRLERLANVLLLNASFIDNPGLLNGKMGIAIFFYQYARYTSCKIFEDYAGELIDEIYEGINTRTPVDFANGLTGIGWGIEYLVKNRFVEANTDEALSEIDNVIYRSSLYQPFLLENSNDLFGYGLYYISRLEESENNEDDLNTLFRKQHLIYLIDDCERILVQKRFLDFNIPSLSIDTINSLLWFLLKMQNIRIFPAKVEKVLQSLPEYIESVLNGLEDNPGQELVLRQTKKIISVIDDKGLKNLFRDIVNRSIHIESASNIPADLLVNNFIKTTWQQLVYMNNSIIKDNSPLKNFGDFFSVIDSEEDWNLRLTKIDKDNIGLTGLAGLGLGLLRRLIQVNHAVDLDRNKSNVRFEN